MINRSNRSISNSGSRDISMFVPELLSGMQFIKEIAKPELPKLSAIQLLLSRASKNQNGFVNFYEGVCALSGITLPDNTIPGQQDVPVAGLTVAVDNKLSSDTNSDYFIFAEPVVMKADRDSVVLLDSLQTGASENKLSLNESQQLIAEINQHFIDEPWELQLSNQGVWYLNLDAKFSILTSDISSVYLQNTRNYLPEGEDALYWRKIINEIEMLLFSSKVNAKRIEQNKMSLTSLWLWGGGKIPEKKHCKNCSLWGDNDFLKTVSQFMGVNHVSLKKQSVSKLIEVNENANAVIVNMNLKQYWQQRNIFAWLDELHKLEVELFKPIVNGLHNGRINMFNLYLDKNTKFSITRKQVKRWWKPLMSLDNLSSL